MNDTPARLLRLLSLLQTPREWPGSELAERLRVSPRTVRRDVERLRDLGYPVDATMGAAGGYRLVAGTAMPPLLLDDEEAVAIAVGLRTAARQAVEGMDEAAVRALAKLEQVLPARLRYRVRTINAATIAMAPLGDPASVDPEHLTALAAAITNHERIRLRYEAHDGTNTNRLVEPHRLVSAGNRWYLVGYDNDRNDWRTFRVDRIDQPRATGVRVAPRQLPAVDAAAYVRRQLTTRAPTYQAVVTLHAPIDQARAGIGRGPGDLEPINDRTCRLHTHTDTLDRLAFWLLMLGCDFAVDQPPELGEHLRTLGARATRAAPSNRAN
jgi:predicted DNA-binding transcriptional regulator YafY